ncbi:uncharacterized protein LOC120799288 isoform X2 [Xiphias gladius]|uniref:uncharacterized protein LOC120799288 isoform X2 n=1 Tax=Xiphias gladius TaxID=8245 RepID=UPI001A97E9B2|nr:uncharacterized protein LOC120799288 isoform X2 [Xiphias gladius]
MDIQQQNRPYLEPIQEESEHEDEIRRSKTGEGEEDSQTHVGVETEDVMAEDKSAEEEEEEEEDDDALLRVLRPRRLSHSFSQESFLQKRSTSNHQEKTKNFSVSDLSTHAVGLSDEATPPGQPKLGNEKWSSSRKLRIKISKIRWHQPTPPKPSVQKKTNRKRHKASSLVKNLSKEELFPQWLMDLMVNIEEATTHQLVVE